MLLVAKPYSPLSQGRENEPGMHIAMSTCVSTRQVSTSTDQKDTFTCTTSPNAPPELFADSGGEGGEEAHKKNTKHFCYVLFFVGRQKLRASVPSTCWVRWPTWLVHGTTHRKRVCVRLTFVYDLFACLFVCRACRPLPHLHTTFPNPDEQAVTLGEQRGLTLEQQFAGIVGCYL